MMNVFGFVFAASVHPELCDINSNNVASKFQEHVMHYKNVSRKSFKNFDLFRFNSQYFAANFSKKIGEGAYGAVYEGIEFTNNQNIVVKYGEIGYYEVAYLKQTELYIAHMREIILMHRAMGESYETILRNKVFTTKEKIDFYNAILLEIRKLNSQGIKHGDLHARHVFVHESQITFIDFGLSTPLRSYKNFEDDVIAFNHSVRLLGQKYCDSVFRNHMKEEPVPIPITLVVLAMLFAIFTCCEVIERCTEKYRARL